jgi:hypothetical protein
MASSTATQQWVQRHPRGPRERGNFATVHLSEWSLGHRCHGSGSKPSLFVFFSGGISPKREIKKLKIRKRSDFGGFQSPKFERKKTTTVICLVFIIM